MLCAALASLLLGCQAPERPARGRDRYRAKRRAIWDAFRDSFIERYFELNPSFAVDQGRHEFDGQIGDWSDAELRAPERAPAGRDRRRRRVRRGAAFRRAELRARLPRSRRAHELFWLEDADQPHTNLTWYFDNGLDPNVYIARPYADAATRMRAFIAYLRAVPAAVAQIRANLAAPMPLSFVEYGIAGFNGFAEYYRGDATAAFAAVDDAALQAELAAAVETAAAAMTETAAWLEGQRATATQDFALGAERFARMLEATEAVTVSLDELEAIGRADLARNRAALEPRAPSSRRAPRSASAWRGWTRAKSPLGPVAEARAQLPALKQFLVDTDLVSIPGTEEALVEEAPPYNRQNSAYIEIPGPYETGMPSVYYIAPPDPAGRAEEQAAYVPGIKNLLFTSVHEVWPGHFLNYLHANRAPSLFGRVFVGYAFAEGWAHYAEELVVEAGLDGGDRRDAHRAALERAAAQLPLSVRDRPARARHDARAVARAVPQRVLSGRRHGAPAVRARHLRSRVSELHARQADDPQAARRLDGEPRRPAGVAGSSTTASCGTAARRSRSCAARCSATTRRRSSAAARLQHRVDRQPRPQPRADALRRRSVTVRVVGRRIPAVARKHVRDDRVGDGRGLRGVVNHDADLGVEVLRARVEVVRADVRDAAVHDETLGVHGEHGASARNCA